MSVYAEGTGQFGNLYKVRYSKAAVPLISTDCEHILEIREVEQPHLQAHFAGLGRHLRHIFKYL